MARLIPTSSLVAGEVVSDWLFTRRGVRLLAPGTRLTSAIVGALREMGEPALVLAPARAMIAEAKPARSWQSRGRRPRAAREGANADAPILQLAAVIEAGELDVPEGALGLDQLQPGPAWEKQVDCVRRVRAVMLRGADQLVGQLSERWKSLPQKLSLGVDPVEVADEDAPWWMDEPARRLLVRSLCERIDSIRERLFDGVAVEAREIESIGNQVIDLCAAHPRRAAQLALDEHESPAGSALHALRTCVLGALVGVRMGASRADVLAIAGSALLSDSGLTRSARGAHQQARPLDEYELNALRRHVSLSAALVTEIDGLDERIAQAIAQHHERNDGSGYPRALREPQIGDIAKVIAVCDTFCALTSERPHRPYTGALEALRQVQSLARAGVLDRAAAAGLVRALGAYPIGTRVRLDDGRSAIVVAAGGAEVNQPRLVGEDGAEFWASPGQIV
jgi:HD-GYP domain-containing protein (c-di-GMP phosphodiesterase class II)